MVADRGPMVNYYSMAIVVTEFRDAARRCNRQHAIGLLASCSYITSVCIVPPTHPAV